MAIRVPARERLAFRLLGGALGHIETCAAVGRAGVGSVSLWGRLDGFDVLDPC
jgi:hypothetical protein